MQNNKNYLNIRVFYFKYIYCCIVFSVKIVFKEICKNLCYGGGGLFRIGWYVINGVYNMYIVLSKVVMGRVYQYVMVVLLRVLLCLNCFKFKGEISYMFL